MNKKITIALAVFILFKWYLTGIMWSGRMLPPEPDDAMIYLSSIESVRKCGPGIFCDREYFSIKKYNGIHSLAYNWFWGTTASVTGMDSVSVFRLSYYVAWVLAGFTVIYVTYFATEIIIFRLSV